MGFPLVFPWFSSNPQGICRSDSGYQISGILQGAAIMALGAMGARGSAKAVAQVGPFAMGAEL